MSSVGLLEGHRTATSRAAAGGDVGKYAGVVGNVGY